MKFVKTLKNKEIEELFWTFGMSIKEIAYEFGMHNTTLYRFIKKNNIKLDSSRRPRRAKNLKKIDIDYFKDIDNAEKAYWLGFVYADGSVSKDTVSLSSKDYNQIMAFKKAIQSEHVLGNKTYFDKRTNKEYVGYYLTVSSKILAGHLINKGVQSNKFKNYPFPDINEVFCLHFLRGLFDGDGLFRLRRDVSPSITITASENILKKIKNIFKKEGINIGYYRNITENPKYSHLFELSIKFPFLNFLDFIYEKSTPETRLKRKYDLYLKYRDSVLNSNRGIKKIRDKFCVRINVEENRHELGCYNDIIDAKRAYNKASVEFFGKFGFRHPNI